MNFAFEVISVIVLANKGNFPFRPEERKWKCVSFESFVLRFGSFDSVNSVDGKRSSLLAGPVRREALGRHRADVGLHDKFGSRLSAHRSGRDVLVCSTVSRVLPFRDVPAAPGDSN